MSEILKYKVGRLAVERMSYEDAKSELDALRAKADAEFEAANQGLIKLCGELSAKLGLLETEVRDDARAVFALHPESKQICDGVGIRVQQVYDYENRLALQWAKQTGLCLELDSRAFKDICKSESNRPDFVTVREQTIATIATDLSKFYPKENAQGI